MPRLVISAAAYLLANAVGLLVASILLPGFTIGFVPFVIVVIVFSALQAVIGPLVSRVASRHLPQLMGGIALVTIFIGLWVTDLLIPAMAMGGISNWLAATLLVWLGSLAATILLPIYVFKSLGSAAPPRARK